MTFKYKNIYVGKRVEPVRKAPPPNPNAIDNLSVIERTKDEGKPLVVTEQHVVSGHLDLHKGYHTVKDGELHKLINTKSDYLKDMMDL